MTGNMAVAAHDAEPSNPTVAQFTELVHRALARYPDAGLARRFEAAITQAIACHHTVPAQLRNGVWVAKPSHEVETWLAVGVMRSAWCGLASCNDYHGLVGADQVIKNPAEECDFCKEDAQVFWSLAKAITDEIANPIPDGEAAPADEMDNGDPAPPDDGRPGMWRHCGHCGIQYWAKTRRSQYCKPSHRQAAYEARTAAGL